MTNKKYRLRQRTKQRQANSSANQSKGIYRIPAEVLNSIVTKVLTSNAAIIVSASDTNQIRPTPLGVMRATKRLRQLCLPIYYGANIFYLGDSMFQQGALQKWIELNDKIHGNSLRHIKHIRVRISYPITADRPVPKHQVKFDVILQDDGTVLVQDVVATATTRDMWPDSHKLQNEGPCGCTLPALAAKHVKTDGTEALANPLIAMLAEYVELVQSYGSGGIRRRCEACGKVKGV